MADLWGAIPGVSFVQGVSSLFKENPFQMSTAYAAGPNYPAGDTINNYLSGQGNPVPNPFGNPVNGGTTNTGAAKGVNTTNSTTTNGGSFTPQPVNNNPQPSGPSQEELTRQRYEAQIRGQIDSGYNDYFAQLDDMFNNGLPSQKAAQENIAQSQYNQGVNTLGNQKTEGLNALGQQRVKAEDQQVKTLRDISNNIRNSMQAGNIYLGTRGAGDSSAANQYAYALTKMGTQQRGDVMNQTGQIMNDIGARETNLRNIFDTESRNLEEAKNQKINEVAVWFADAQNQLRQAKANGQLRKSQDLQALTTNLFNQAMQELNNVRQYAQQRQGMLESWAASNASNIQQLKANMSQVGAFQAPGVNYTAFDGRPNTSAPNTTTPYYPGAQIGGQDDTKQSNSIFPANGYPWNFQ